MVLVLEYVFTLVCTDSIYVALLLGIGYRVMDRRLFIFIFGRIMIFCDRQFPM